MPYVVLVINDPNNVIQTLKDKTYTPTKPEDGIQLCAAYLNAIDGGANPASVQLTVRDNDPSVSTHGTGSVQTTYSKL